MKRAIAILGAIASLFFAGEAKATVNFFWRDTPTSTRVVISGLTPNSAVTVFTPLRLFAQQPRYCGYVKVRWPSDLNSLYLFTSNGLEIANDTPSFDGTCLSTSGWSSQPPESFYQPTATGISVFFRASSSVDINTEGLVRRISKTANSCGLISVSFRKFANPSWNPVIRVGSQSSAFNGTTSVAPRCINGILYVPVN